MGVARSHPAPAPRRTRRIDANLANFPKVTQVVSQVGRPDDGAMPADLQHGILLLPLLKWRFEFKNKTICIAAHGHEPR